MINYFNTIKKETNIIPKTILEIGSRDGDDANELKKLFSITNDNVYLVEPNPTQVDVIKNKYPYYKLYDVGILDLVGETLFYQYNNENKDLVGTSSFLNRTDGFYDNKNVAKIKINTITGKSLLKDINKNIDLCKIDVEGATLNVLKSFGDKLNTIKSFHLEVEHKQYWENQSLYEEIKMFMELNGYIELYKQSVYVEQSDVIYVFNQYLI